MSHSPYEDPYIYSDEFADIETREVVLDDNERQAFVDAMLIQGRALFAAIGFIILCGAIYVAAVRLHTIEQQLVADARV